MIPFDLKKSKKTMKDTIMDKCKVDQGKAMVFRFGRMVFIILACGARIRQMDTGSLCMIKESTFKGVGMQARRMEKGDMLMRMKGVRLKGCGLMGSDMEKEKKKGAMELDLR